MRRHRSFLRIFLCDPFATLFFFGPALAAALLSYATVKQSVLDYRLAHDGAATTANVTDLNVSSGEGSHTYEVRYSFLHEDRWFTGIESVSQDFFETLHEEDVLPVRFWREDPSISEIEDRWSEANLIWGMAFSAYFAAFSLLGLAITTAQARKIMWAERVAVRIHATVTKHEYTGKDEESAARAFWCTETGETGATGYITAVGLPPVGSMIAVLTDPSGKRESRWEGNL